MGTHRSKHNKGRKPRYKNVATPPWRDAKAVGESDFATADDWAREVAARLISGGPRAPLVSHCWTGIHWTDKEQWSLDALCTAGVAPSKSADILGRSEKSIVWRARDTGIALPKAWRALVAPPPKPRLVRVNLAYPYVMTRRDQNADILAVNDLVPKALPEWARADICQNIMLAVLEGETTIDELRARRDKAVYFVGKFLKQQRDWRLISLEGVADDDRNYYDIAASVSADEWDWEEMNNARHARDGLSTHVPATQERAVHDSLMLERQRAWDSRGLSRSLDEIKDIMGGGKILDRHHFARLQGMTTRQSLFERQHERCAYCECEMTLRIGFPNSVTRDHIVARSEGGSDDDSNLVGACQECNERKGSLPVAEFLAMVRPSAAQPARTI